MHRIVAILTVIALVALPFQVSGLLAGDCQCGSSHSITDQSPGSETDSCCAAETVDGCQPLKDSKERAPCPDDDCKLPCCSVTKAPADRVTVVGVIQFGSVVVDAAPEYANLMGSPHLGEMKRPPKSMITA